MPRRYKKRYIKALLDELAKKTGHSLDHYGFDQMSDAIGGSINQKYIYYSLYHGVRNVKDPDESLSLAPNKIDEIVNYLGYKSFEEFIADIEAPLHPILESLASNYKSYIRKNSSEGKLLQSPASITISGGKAFLSIEGPQRKFSGEIKLNNGCCSCLLSASEKSFYHVYKIGKMRSPQVIQGIFSGASSAGDPIGGRCLLVKTVEEFSKLSNEQLTIEDLLKSSKHDQYLAAYFENFEANNLRVKAAIGFDFGDLV